MTLPDNILTPVGNLRGQLTSGGLIPVLPIITGEASGTVASFPDGAEEPIKSIDILISAASSEVNIISNNINIWDNESEIGAYNNTTGLPQPITSLTRCKNPIKVTPSTSYYLNIGTTSALNILQYDENLNYLGITYLIQNTSSRAFTVSPNTYYIKFYFLGTTFSDIGINYPSTIDHYVEHHTIKYNISLPTTISDGYIHIEHNLGWTGYVYDNLTSTIYTLQPEDIPHIITLYGYNNIWSDVGDIINCKYIRDLNLTINLLWNAVFP